MNHCLRSHRIVLLGRVSLLSISLGTPIALIGQTTSWQYNPPTSASSAPSAGPVNMVPQYSGATSPNWGTNWNPQTALSGVGSIINAPNANALPSTDQTRWYVNNHPDLKSLDPGWKEAIIYGGAGSGLLNGAYLPNGRPNPFTQPNWYLPATWSSTTMSWQGVQANGFLPASRTSTYNPTSFSPTYNFNSGVNTSNNRTLPPVYRMANQPSSQMLRPSQPSPPMSMSTTGKANENPSHALALPVSNIAKSLEDAQRTLSMHEAAGDKIAQVIGHAGLAVLYSENGDFDKASEQRSLAKRMAKEISDPNLQADVLRSSAASHLSLGEFEEALADYHKAMPILRSVGDEKGQAEVYASVGWVNESLGNIPDALRCYAAALDVFGKLGDRDGEVRILMGIASLYESTGEFERAAAQYQKAIGNASKPQQARILASFGDMNLSLDDVSLALRQYEAAFSLVQDSEDPALQGAILAGIGRCHMLRDNDPRRSKAQESRNTNQHVPELIQDSDPGPSDAVVAEIGRPTFHDYPKGSKPLDFLELARTKMVEAANRTGEAGVLATIGELNYSTAIRGGTILNPASRYFNQAIDNYNKALALMQQTGDQLGEVGVLTNLGLSFDAEGKYHDALKYYREALDVMDQVQTAARIEEFRMNIASQSAGLYERAILLEIGLGHHEEAFNLSERARARTFLDQLGNRRINAHLPDDFIYAERELRKQNISLQRRIGQEMSRPAPEVNQDKISALESQQRNLQKQYLERVRALKIQNPEYASFLSISPLTLHEVQQQIPTDVTAVSYFVTSPATLVFVVTKNSFHVKEIPVDEPTLAWTVSNLLDFSSENEVQASLKALQRALIAPIKSHLKTANLAFVPYGVLNDVPFAALTDGKRYLGDDFAVFSLPSLSVFPYIRARNKSAAGKAMVVANDWQEGLPFLENAYGEARDVASILGAEPLLGDDATVSSLQKYAGNYEIIHLIAHIDHDRNSPEISRVILGHGEHDEGALDLNQVVELDLKKTSLVVLSGCQSQAGKRSRNDDVVGLTRAFIYAGSPSVVASLWSVDDEATRALMVSFYTHLKHGLGKAEALRAAQMEVRQKYPNPYYWAGFVLTGDPGGAPAGDVLARASH